MLLLFRLTKIFPRILKNNFNLHQKKNWVHWKPNWLSKYLLQATIGDDAPREVKFTDDNGRVRIGTVTGTSVSSSVSVSTSTNNDAEDIKGTIYEYRFKAKWQKGAVHYIFGSPRFWTKKRLYLAPTICQTFWKNFAFLESSCVIFIRRYYCTYLNSFISVLY